MEKYIIDKAMLESFLEQLEQIEKNMELCQLKMSAFIIWLYIL